MTIFKHEWRQARLSFALWTGAMASLLFICMMIFPEMKEEMEDVNRIFSAMGAFTAAFGMDKLNFGEAMGFYGIECGNIVGMGGALLAALTGISALSSEEKSHTAEFLLTHPVSRSRIVAQKLLAVMTLLLACNVVLVFVASGSFVLIGETLKWKEFLLLHLAYLLLEVEIAAICFGISAFLKRGGPGIGIGLAVVFYFLNLIANISGSAEFLQYLTPFGYAEASEIMENGSLNPLLVGIGLAVTACGIAAAFWKYGRKDISA